MAPKLLLPLSILITLLQLTSAALPPPADANDVFVPFYGSYFTTERSLELCVTLSGSYSCAKCCCASSFTVGPSSPPSPNATTLVWEFDPRTIDRCGLSYGAPPLSVNVSLASLDGWNACTTYGSPSAVPALEVRAIFIVPAGRSSTSFIFEAGLPTSCDVQVGPRVPGTLQLIPAHIRRSQASAASALASRIPTFVVLCFALLLLSLLSV
jgi:hypothetical protein